MNKEILPVLDEISAVLKRHDMAGLVMVANATHVDFRMEIEPSWSCAWLIKDEAGKMVGVRFRSKLAEYPSKEAQKKCQEATIGTFVTFNDTMDVLKENLEQILVMLSRHIDFIGKSTREDG